MAVIPYADQPDVARRSVPFVTVGLVALNILVFLFELRLPHAALADFVRAWGVVPAEVTSGRDLPPPVPAPVYITLLTSQFIHGGFLHIAGNVLFLWVFGDNVEDALGHLTFLAFYLGVGVIAGLVNAFALAGSTVPGIGASGAIAGVLAGYLLLFGDARVRALLLFGPFFTVGRVSALLLIGFWFLLQLGQGVASLGVPAQEGGVAYFAHIGGFLAGLVLVPAIRALRRQPVGHLPEEVWVGPTFRNWLLLVVTLVGLLGGTALLAAQGAEAAAVLLRAVVAVGALLGALVDAWRRILGRPSFLGSATRVGRVLAWVQLLGALAAAGALVSTLGPR